MFSSELTQTRYEAQTLIVHIDKFGLSKLETFFSCL